MFVLINFQQEILATYTHLEELDILFSVSSFALYALFSGLGKLGVSKASDNRYCYSIRQNLFGQIDSVFRKLLKLCVHQGTVVDSILVATAYPIWLQF